MSSNKEDYRLNGVVACSDMYLDVHTHVFGEVAIDGQLKFIIGVPSMLLGRMTMIVVIVKLLRANIFFEHPKEEDREHVV